MLEAWSEFHSMLKNTIPVRVVSPISSQERLPECTAAWQHLLRFELLGFHSSEMFYSRDVSSNTHRWERLMSRRIDSGERVIRHEECLSTAEGVSLKYGSVFTARVSFVYAGGDVWLMTDTRFTRPARLDLTTE